MSPTSARAAAGAPPAADIPRPARRFADTVRTTTHRSPVAPTLRLATTPAWHLARRAAQAPTADIAADIARLGPAAWVEQQLSPTALDDRACEDLVRSTLPWAGTRVADIKADPRSEGHWWEGAPHLADSLLVRAVFTRRVLRESVVECLSDHVYVAAAGRGELGCTDHDIDVLRPHALGRYADLLHAAVTSVGLLRYLNNEVNSRDSINENLGRELLELHTVGTGAYTQADVRDSARILSGHGFEWSTLRYVYRPTWHATGPVQVMGFTHANATAAGGPKVLEAYVDYLARHPRTAERLCRRLAVRFVSDTPSAALVAELASVYLAADTDLTPVLRRLFAHREFATSVGAKTKRPFEWVAGAVRSGRPTTFDPLRDTIARPWEHCAPFWTAWDSGHAPRQWPDVDGYPDVAARWLSSMNMLGAFNGAQNLADPWDASFGKPSWPTVLGLAVGQNAWVAARSMTTQLTGWVWSERDLAPVVSYLAAHQGGTVPWNARLNDDSIRWHLTPAVRMVLASPYARIR